MGLAAVFAGLAVLMAVLGFVYHLFLLVVAIPFGLVSYTLWYHASGRLREQVNRQSRGARRAQARARREAEAGGFGAGPREEWTGPRGGFEGARGNGFGSGGRNASGRRRAPSTSGLSTAEAYDVLGLDPGADPDSVKKAYRKKVKDVHPDTEEGNEAAFKRVQKAYERLRNGHGR